MARILFLAHRIPYPPNKGDKIRSWNILRRLADRHEVHLGCFVDDPDDTVHLDTLRQHCASVFGRRIRPGLRKIASLAGLLTGRPLSVQYYSDRPMRRWVDERLAEEDIDAVFLFSSPMALFIDPGANDLPVIMDFCDIDSAKWGQYGETKAWPLSALYRREARTLSQLEKDVAEAVDVVSFVSPDEAAAFTGQAGETAAKVVAVRNGVDTDFFDPHPLSDSPYGPGRHVAFTGAMDYWPNEDAAVWFAGQVWPKVQDAFPQAHFHIVGGRPGPGLREMGKSPHMTVHGRVADIRPYIAGADVIVAPMRLGQGVQNKVLEGMAMARPVVTTTLGLVGIDAEPGREILVGDDAGAFAARVEAVLRGEMPPGLGENARSFVQKDFNWDNNLAIFDNEIERLLGT